MQIRDCECTTCQATDRLYALADVFEHLGDYSAADCCREWALRTHAVNPASQRMAAAILHGRGPRWSGTP